MRAISISDELKKDRSISNFKKFRCLSLVIANPYTILDLALKAVHLSLIYVELNKELKADKDILDIILNHPVKRTNLGFIQTNT